ncbi:MAG: DUF4258 domain-containing protein [Acetobacteraceae bacterium]
MASTRLPNETARLHAIVSGGGLRIRFTGHARQEMAKDAITEPDAMQVPKHGRVTWIETKKEEQWHVEGRDVDGKSIRLVVVVYPEEAAVKVITAMELRRGT